MNQAYKKINIGIDLDGVIIDHTLNKIKFAKNLGLNLRKEDTPSIKLGKILEKKFYLPIQNYIYREGTKTAIPFKDSKRYLRFLQKRVNLYIISRRFKGESRKQAKLWIKTNLENLINLDQVFFVNSDKEKNKLAKKLKVKIFLDDNISVLKHLDDSIYKFLFYPFPLKGVPELKEALKKYQIKRVSSWKNFYRQVKKLLKKLS